MEKTIQPVAKIYTDFKEKFGIPRQSGRSPSSKGIIVFEKKFRNPNALKEIEGFSHLWLIFDFSAVRDNSEFIPMVRPPRLGGNKKVGVFASRSPFRPNKLGLSCVKLESVEHTLDNGEILVVSGVDLLDGTPIYDIKPYLPHADCKEDAIGGYADEFSEYRLKVEFVGETEETIPKDKLLSLIECLSEDPRPSYQEDGKIYGFAFDKFNVKFKVKNQILYVIEVENID